MKIIERISSGAWAGIWTQDRVEMSESDWDKLPYSVVMRAYALESPIILED